MTRYLLGELSESEQAALEEKYFTDPHVFEQILKTESELVDNYVRGQMSSHEREQFEHSYLAHPRRRERVKFAEALATRLDEIEAPATAAKQPAWTMSRWQRLLGVLRGQRSMLGFSTALVLLVMVGGVWFFIEGRHVRRESSQATQVDQERRERDLQQQRERELEQRVATERKQAEELTAERERLQRAQQQTTQPAPIPPLRAATAPTFVTLLLTVGGVRGAGTGQMPTLVIPPGTAQARLQLNLKENDYPNYRVSLQAVGGREIFSQQGLKPRPAKSGASFVLTVPAHKLAAGDYILTLKGVSQDGEIDDLSKSIFRVEKS